MVQSSSTFNKDKIIGLYVGNPFGIPQLSTRDRLLSKGHVPKRPLNSIGAFLLTTLLSEKVQTLTNSCT